MQAWLAPHVRASRVGADLVLLDIAADAYFCLLDAAEHLTLHPDGSIEPRPAEAVQDLLEAGFLLGAPAGTPPIHPPPVDRGLDVGQSTFPLWRLPGALRANLDAAYAIEALTFAEILALAGPLDPAALAQPSAVLLTEAERFERLAPWLPRSGLCLMRSLQQRLYLSRRGHAAAWVFGVRTWPFQAHCWLQAGEVVLNDAPSRVTAFTPIMVV